MQVYEIGNGVAFGWVYLGSDLSATFAEVVGTSSFIKQHQLRNVLRFGKTGDWVELITELDNLFTVTSVTKYAMQLAEKVKIGRASCREVASNQDAKYAEKES